MAKLRLTLAVSLLFAGLSLYAQEPCVWSEEPGQIVQDCGKVGIGIRAPWGGLHVRGSGQTATNPELTSATNHGSVLFLQDSGSEPGNGGMVAFGAAQGHFAAIKGAISDGRDNTMGALLFATRQVWTDTALTERMRIHGNGHVAIGTIGDAARLYVYQSDPSSWAFNSTIDSTISQSGSLSSQSAVLSATQNVLAGVTNSGGALGSHTQALNTGAGFLNQTAGQAIYSGSNAQGTVDVAYGSIINIMGAPNKVHTGYGLYIQDVSADTGFSIFQTGANDVNYFAGKVGIGTSAPASGLAMHVVGNAQFDGTVTGTYIKAHYQDVAEWVPAKTDLSAGTVVVLDPSAGNAVMASTRAYDTTVAGVVSEQPGIILGVEGASKEQIATTGRVRVKVDASRGAIAVGDLLVTSDEPGYAMRSTPIDVGGALIHRPGTIVGKALEPLASGQGEILVLLSLQ